MMKFCKDKTMDLCQVEIGSIKNDDQLRKAVRQNKNNGGYARIICRQCGRFITNCEGNVATAKIIDECSHCGTQYEF